MTALRRLALCAASATYLLIVVGAIVRTTGSGLGCGDDWPLCEGRLLPPPNPAAIIEWTHRLLGALVSPGILAVALLAWAQGRSRPAVVVPAILAPVLLAVQIGLGAVVVRLDLAAMVVLVHLAFALVILGLLVWVAVAAAAGSSGLPPGARLTGHLRSRAAERFEKLVIVTAGATFLLILIGAYVRASGAGWACLGFPGCNGQALPFGTSRQVDLHLAHRLVAYIVTALALTTAWQARRLEPARTRLRRAAAGLAGLVLVQIGIGVWAVSVGPGPWVQSAHVAGAAAVWVMAVALTARTFTGDGRRAAGDQDRDDLLPVAGSQPPSPKRVMAAYVQLTKPRVMALLLITTLAAMLMAQRGLPPLGLIFFTLLGGALAAGGAGAINHYLDRDVDQLMGRTATRPIPAGLVPPWHALVFGIVLGLLSFAILTVFVNLLSAVLSLLALLFYVFVYTCWLKRLTPANIVIGGAAGSVPPVVGIAAVTNEISPLALFLFTIIFVWTPPHFWALSLLMRRQYEAAGIPMLPIVSGDDETRRQILFYSLLMVAVTVVVFWLGLLGSLYLVSALGLGGLFIYYAVRLRREASDSAARRLFHYSMLYLALLFSAMVVDRQVVL